jgi:myosin heavy subunit
MAGEVLKQLQYSGMMEAIRIRREGYALREEHESFFDRFSVLLSPDDLKGDEARIVQLVKALSKRLGVSNADWQVGHSKIFLRRELSDKLERLAKLRVHCAARTLTKFGKNVAQKRLGMFVVTWARFRLRMLERKRERKAAAAIVALVRGRKQMLLYAATRQAVIRIQTEQRRLIAVNRVRKIRDPFCEMTYRECKKLLVAEQESLDSAVAAKNFRLAAKLEAKM